MRKFVKKVVAATATLTMSLAFAVNAFAADSYTFVGSPALFGEANQGDTNVGWVPTAENQVLADDDGDGIFTGTYNFVAPTWDDATPAEKRKIQFKVVGDGGDFAWSYQLCIGNPDAAWADNQSQFQVEDTDITAGEYTVYVEPKDGMICLVQNNKILPMSVRYHSRDEDPSNFVPVTEKDIKAEGYDDAAFTDAGFKTFEETVAKLSNSVLPGASTTEETTAAVTDETTTNTETLAETTTAANKETTTAAATTTKKADKDDDGISPVVIVVIVVAVVAVIGIVVAVAKKKKNN